MSFYSFSQMLRHAVLSPLFHGFDPGPQSSQAVAKQCDFAAPVRRARTAAYVDVVPNHAPNRKTPLRIMKIVIEH